MAERDEIREQARLIHNERTKLDAAWNNTISAASYLGASVTIPLTLTTLDSATSPRAIGVWIVYGMLFVASFYYRREARRIIQDLR